MTEVSKNYSTDALFSKLLNRGYKFDTRIVPKTSVSHTIDTFLQIPGTWQSPVHDWSEEVNYYNFEVDSTLNDGIIEVSLETSDNISMSVIKDSETFTLSNGNQTIKLNHFLTSKYARFTVSIKTTTSGVTPQLHKLIANVGPLTVDYYAITSFDVLVAYTGKWQSPIHDWLSDVDYYNIEVDCTLNGGTVTLLIETSHTSDMSSILDSKEISFSDGRHVIRLNDLTDSRYIQYTLNIVSTIDGVTPYIHLLNLSAAGMRIETQTLQMDMLTLKVLDTTHLFDLIAENPTRILSLVYNALLTGELTYSNDLLIDIIIENPSMIQNYEFDVNTLKSMLSSYLIDTYLSYGDKHSLVSFDMQLLSMIMAFIDYCRSNTSSLYSVLANDSSYFTIIPEDDGLYSIAMVDSDLYGITQTNAGLYSMTNAESDLFTVNVTNSSPWNASFEYEVVN